MGNLEIEQNRLDSDITVTVHACYTTASIYSLTASLPFSYPKWCSNCTFGELNVLYQILLNSHRKRCRRRWDSIHAGIIEIETPFDNNSFLIYFCSELSLLSVHHS